MKQPLEEWIHHCMRAMAKSLCLRAFMMAMLTLILIIPIRMIDGVIRQRQTTRSEAQSDVTDSWGNPQHLRGPWISIPYTHRWMETFQQGDKTQTVHREEKRWAAFLPEALHVDGTILNEIRHRGIYQVPLYTGTFQISGHFAQPKFSQWGVSAKDIHWDEATVSLALSDARGIVEQTSIEWQDTALPFMPGLAADPESMQDLKTHSKHPAITSPCCFTFAEAKGFIFRPWARTRS